MPGPADRAPSSPATTSRASSFVKRALDVVGSLGLLSLASPVMLGVAIAIKRSSPGPVFHVHDRVGLHGNHFAFIKFRSMHVDCDDQVHRDYVKRWIKEGQESANDVNGKKRHKLLDDPRVFAFGRFIRKYSIDELPQLLNVLRGEMSLVGPRPALPYEVESYSAHHRRRFEGLPGITGLWQVSGRNRLSFEEMVELDIQYLETWSVLADLRILARTIGVVLFDPAD